MLAHLSARSLGARLAPEGLSLPDRLPEPEALLWPFWEELCEPGLLSCSSQPPPACPGRCLAAGRIGESQGLRAGRVGAWVPTWGTGSCLRSRNPKMRSPG